MTTELMETVHIEEAVKAEQEAPPGLLEVRFYTATPLTGEDAQAIFDHLWKNNIDVRKVYVYNQRGLPYLGVVYNRPPPITNIAALPIAIIPLIAFGMIAALVGIGIFKLEQITQSIGKLLLIVFGGTILVALIAKKPLEAAATKAMRV
jgi:hypothetical protein